MLEHGGGIVAASKKFNVLLLKDWIDLSTGINPEPYPLPPIDPAIWRSLPQDDDGLFSVAMHYYGLKDVLPVSGSQAAIQALPFMRPQSKVGVLCPTYTEHAHAWKKGGHALQQIYDRDLKTASRNLDVLVVCNPNNPTGEFFDTELLLDCHQVLSLHGGWLVADEAFIDTQPKYSLMSYTGNKGLIVLRSLGKFFGLAGARVGFVGAWSELLHELNESLGPWTISGPSRFAAQCALKDTNWQTETKVQLKANSKRLGGLLRTYGLVPQGSTDFFQWVLYERAYELYCFLGGRGILTRHFFEPSSLRFGLPAGEDQWLRLEEALQMFSDSRCLTGGEVAASCI